jgi:hypothetical protein
MYDKITVALFKVHVKPIAVSVAKLLRSSPPILESYSMANVYPSYKLQSSIEMRCIDLVRY